VTVNRIPSAETPGRRDSFGVVFWCEQCDGKEFELVVEQHKGETLICWAENYVKKD
jgi:hypothetical protein